MKKLILILLTNVAFAQTVSLTQNTSYGNNCGVAQPTTPITINGDLNLNGYTLNLRNVNLTVTGNLNGGGTISHCGNSTLCVRGAVQNNPNLNDLSCTLSIEEYTFQLNYTIYNLKGEIIKKGFTNNRMYSDLPKKEILILKVEGFKPVKIMLE